MRTLTIAVPLVLAACSGGSDGSGDEPTGSPTDGFPGGCGYDSLDPIRSDELPDLEVPTGQQGSLEDVVVGIWQHVFIYDDGEPLSPISDDTTDIRFAIPDTETFIYCQDVTPDVDGGNESSLTIDGTKLDIAGPGYTATAWTDQTMVWRNDLYEDKDQFYVLQRLY